MIRKLSCILLVALAACSPGYQSRGSILVGDATLAAAARLNENVVVVGAPRAGAALYLWSPQASTPSLLWQSQPAAEGTPSLLGTAVGSAGDLDGDGQPEFYVSDPRALPRAEVRLYKLVPGGLPRLWRTLTSSVAGDGFGEAVSAVGDVDLDGFSDLAIADFSFNKHRGRVLIYKGARGGPEPQAVWTAQGESEGDWFGYSLAGPGDLDGDGYADLLVSSKNCSGACTRWLEGDPRFEIHRRYLEGLAPGDSGATAKAGRVQVFFGGPKGLGRQAGLQIEGEHPLAFYGFKLAPLGDSDGDGVPEWLVSAPGWMARRGLVDVLSAPKRKLVRLARFEGKQDGDEMGQILASAGDVDADGRGDLLVGSVTRNRLELWWGRRGPQRWDDVRPRRLDASGLRWTGAAGALQSGYFYGAARRGEEALIIVMSGSDS